MQKRDLPYLVFGILIGTVAACRSTNLLDGPTTLEPEWVEASTAAVAAQPRPAPTGDPLLPTTPLPTPLPTADDWQPLGSDRAGLSLGIPVAWVNLTEQSDTPAMGNRLGINLVFAADTERTGRSLLAGKPFESGAYVSGLIIAPPATADPAAALVDLLATAAPTAVRLTDPAPLTSANGVPGYTLDVADGPIGLNAGTPNDLRTRVALFTPAPAGGSPVWIVLLLSASASRWDAYAETFAEMLRSARVFDVRPGTPAQEGNVVVRGQLAGDNARAGATLERSVNDLWTFTTAANRYASLSLTPADPHLDLTLSLLDPNRQTVAHIDNGYAGVAETATDIRLTQPGVYIVAVSDFYGAAGGYDLALTLADAPQHDGGGTIGLGQALQSDLPPNGQHTWVFQGTAQQRVSIVVEPGAPTLDALLDLYGPDGQRLVALDEGFSGDPELLSGFSLPATGEYAILVRSFAPQGGPYTLSLDEGDQPIANYYDAGDLLYGDARRETLQPREVHTWFFQGRAGDHILIRVSPATATLDLDVWLVDAGMERVAAADAFAAGEPETIELTLAGDGQYIILVRDFNGEHGDYEIVLGAAPIATPENAGDLSYGDAVLGTIKPDTAVAWSFNAQAGDRIAVVAQPAEANSDLILQLQGPDGLAALELDDRPAGEAETLAGFVVPAAGTWRLVLREFFGQTAAYRLELRRGQ